MQQLLPDSGGGGSNGKGNGDDQGEDGLIVNNQSNMMSKALIENLPANQDQILTSLQQHF